VVPAGKYDPLHMRMRVLLEPRDGATYEQLLAMARVTEEVGFDAFFRSDHYLGIVRGNPRFFPTDSWTTLGGLARDTRRVRLGTLVTASTFRLPGVLAIAAATADAMSGGRIELGLGAAWYTQEHETLGIPFPAIGQRFDRLEEQLAIITGLWTTPPGERFSFEGRHYRLEECANFPRPAQSPRPPIIIGGGGPKRTPTLAARFADEYNAGFGGDVGARFERFRNICEGLGRDPATVSLSIAVPVFCGSDDAEVARRAQVVPGGPLLEQSTRGRPEVVVEKIHELAAVGADTVYFHIFDVDDLDHIRLLGREVLPRVPPPAAVGIG
jgi:F420-dependent oxidoreductase-like protein